MEKYNMYIGMDTDKKNIDVAIATRGIGREERHYGRIENSRAGIDKLYLTRP